MIAAWFPLILVLASVLYTFRAGFWNIGVEGQIVIGAVSTTYIIRILQVTTISPTLVIMIGLAFGVIGGGVWALISAVLKTQSGLHEIVSGIGLNVLALAISNWLILGPWRRFGAGSLGGTDMFNQAVWLPEIGSIQISYLFLFFGLILYFGVSFLLRRTRYGLQLAAFHLNPKAKYINASFTSYSIWRIFVLSGMLSGFTGAILVLGTYHRLIPSVSSGMGYVAILISLMVYQQPLWAAIVALIFSMTNINSSQLAMQYQLAPSIVGVFQAGWAFCMLVIYQAFQKVFRIRE
jgi:simple sugar transport system permease protein